MLSREYGPFIIFAVFIASGISFLPGKFPRDFVRSTVAIVGIFYFLIVLGIIMQGNGFSAGVGAYPSGENVPRTLEDGLAGLYFVVCSLTCLPIILKRNLRSFGLGLHFIYFPTVVCLATMFTSVSVWYRFGAFGGELSRGLIYAMLWFRMIDMQKAVALPSATVSSEEMRLFNEGTDGKREINEESRKTKPLFYEPDVAIRLAWWFGINGIPLAYCFIGGPMMFALYPSGLAMPFLSGTNMIHDSTGATAERVMWVCGGFYIVHFILTLVIPNKRVFWILVWVLFAALVLNLSGCAMMLSGLSQIH